MPGEYAEVVKDTELSMVYLEEPCTVCAGSGVTVNVPGDDEPNEPLFPPCTRCRGEGREPRRAIALEDMLELYILKKREAKETGKFIWMSLQKNRR